MAKKGEGCAHTEMLSTESSHRRHTRKNKKKNPDRMELKLYDPTLRRHVLYRESKKSSK